MSIRERTATASARRAAPLRWGFLPLLAAAGSLAAAAPLGGGEAAFLRAAGQADLSTMPAFFAAAEVGDDPVMRELRTAFEQRFTLRTEPLSPETGDLLIDGLVQTFRRYWTEALVAPGIETEAARLLEQSLAAVLDANGVPPQAGSDPLERAARAAEAAGYGISISKTPPLNDLVVWTGEERAYYRVDLTDGAETVEVVFVDGLVSQGWRHFASLGLHSTTGWTSGGALYCVRWAYDPHSEHFRVSYLKHEARHVADFRKFPGLGEADMEYRAKLTELAFAGPSARDILRRFAVEGNRDGASAHALANERVAQDLYRELLGRPLPEVLDPWTLPGPDRINAAARRLLERNTRALQ